MHDVCLVGAGNIARTHAEALATPGTGGHLVTCVVDPDLAAARRLSPSPDRAFASLNEALAAGGFDRAHVLTPPDTHAAIASQLLAAGKSVLLEKPLATRPEDGQRLLELGGQLGINQNFVFHPAFVRLRRLLDSGALGQLRSVSCIYNVPLRQLAARQFSHWMFQTPVNILLEQAVHPLSQLATLVGEFTDIKSVAGPPVPTGPGRMLFPTFDAILVGCVPAQLRFAVGETFPCWQITLVCDDGVAVADILANRLLRQKRTRWLELVDGAASGLRSAGDLGRDSLANFGAAVGSMLRLRPRSDAFFCSMRDSIAAFHGAVDAGSPLPLDAKFGAHLVDACWRIAEAAEVSAPAHPKLCAPASVAAVRPDVAVLGGTGFIGSATVAALLESGRRVAVMARSVQNLPARFDDRRVTLHRGSITDPAATAAAVAGAPMVVNLAHGGGGATWQAIRDAMVGGAETVAKVCKAGNARLIHVGSIASLYLGPQPGVVTGATPPDSLDERRADYARAKILCDRMLTGLAADGDLRLVLLRPGLVVGAGTSPFHSGVGFYNTDQHCIGWNEGRNPLPFVLVTDTADAIRRACDADGIEGHAYNLVGDVRPSARNYIAALAGALRRPLVFHPQTPRLLWSGEMVKWLVKRAGGRAVPVPPLRDLLSRGLSARFDCADAKRDLGWSPVAEHDRFLDLAVAVHARAS